MFFVKCTFGRGNDNKGNFDSKTNSDTPPKFNMEPENDGLEDEVPFPGVYSQVPC